jgi:hypothetical protein
MARQYIFPSARVNRWFGMEGAALEWQILEILSIAV